MSQYAYTSDLGNIIAHLEHRLAHERQRIAVLQREIEGLRSDKAVHEKFERTERQKLDDYLNQISLALGCAFSDDFTVRIKELQEANGTMAALVIATANKLLEMEHQALDTIKDDSVSYLRFKVSNLHVEVERATDKLTDIEGYLREQAQMYDCPFDIENVVTALREQGSEEGSGWTSVTDKLPPENVRSDRVLVNIISTLGCTGAVVIGYTEFGKWYGDDGRMLSSANIGCFTVTHWKPLPDPIKLP